MNSFTMETENDEVLLHLRRLKKKELEFYLSMKK